MQGDWQGLMAQHNHSVVLALLARGVPLNQAKELAHDAWTRLFEAHLAGKFSGLALPGLAIRQALFLAATQRKARRWTAVPVEDAAQLADYHATPDTRVELRQLLARTQTATAELSARAQNIFHTVLDNPDVPQVQLAQRLGISLQRLRQTLCEARTRLRGALEETP
ncbi:MAG: sigma-70 family RNA polymerase sigma factor [Myxococcaceae bacterium]|nr:sigma-70 family RNA polymerase sigma factor [Myxococcaceae bacterium]